MPATAAAVKAAPEPGVRTTITGEVMDPACFLEAGVKSIGPGSFPVRDRLCALGSNARDLRSGE